MPQRLKGTEKHKDKILFVLEYYYPNIGGVERLFKALTEHHASEGMEVTVLTNRFDRSLPKRETINGVNIRRLNFWNRYFFTFFSFPWILHYGRKADMIHTTSFNAALPAYVGAKLLGRKIIITFHEAWGKLWFRLPFINSIQRRLFYWYERLILKFRFDTFVAVSDYTKECLIQGGVHPDRIQRIYNGLDYGNKMEDGYNPPDEFIFTFFGRLGPSKGIDLLMEASAEFLKKNPRTKLKLIITRKPEYIYSFIKNSIKRNKIENRVKIMHHLTDHELQMELKNSSCVVIPSASEGFCFAAAETIAMGIPLISSDQGALKEVVSGKFIKMEKYDAASLVQALSKARNQQWDKKSLKKFELSECLKFYLELYSEI